MPQERSLRFAEDPHDRFWWHHVPGRDYVPAVYRLLSDDEWQVMEEWYEETAARNAVGEWNPPAMSLIHGFIDGGGLHRVAQIGHYYGYSVLLVGFWLRAMGGDRRLVSIDIDEEAGITAQKEPSLVEFIAYRDTWRNGLDSFLAMLRRRLRLSRAKSMS